MESELEYHERLYSGFAQQHFARPAIRAFRAHLASHIRRTTGAGPRHRVLSLGCGIGDTELLLAPYVRELVGLDLSPTAIRQAREDAEAAGVRNTRFLEGSPDSIAPPDEPFDLIVAIFFLHHLPDVRLRPVPSMARKLLGKGGKFYALDPSRYRLSGAIGSLLLPSLMRKYQSPDERPLDAKWVVSLFRESGFECTASFYDFISTPLSGLFPGWRAGYEAARRVDNLLIRVPLVRLLGSNFELLATTND